MCHLSIFIMKFGISPAENRDSLISVLFSANIIYTLNYSFKIHDSSWFLDLKTFLVFLLICLSSNFNFPPLADQRYLMICLLISEKLKYLLNEVIYNYFATKGIAFSLWINIVIFIKISLTAIYSSSISLIHLPFHPYYLVHLRLYSDILLLFKIIKLHLLRIWISKPQLRFSNSFLIFFADSRVVYLFSNFY